MQFNVTDSAGNPAVVIVQSTDAVADHSGAIAATGASQTLLEANPARSGFLVQNRGKSGDAMVINELGADAMVVASWAINPGETFPPPGYPVQLGPITIAGTLGDAYTCREW